jgi:hypothetical protein
MSIPTPAEELSRSPLTARFWREARERKWLYLIGGVLLGALVVFVLLRAIAGPAYVSPLGAYPNRLEDPLAIDRPLNYPTRALNNFPVYPSAAGGQVMPVVNRTSVAKEVREAFFYEKNAGRPLIPGVAVPAYEFRFEPRHYVPERRCWAREIDDLTLPANAETRVVVRLVDPARAGQRRYGTLVLRCEDGELIQFESAQVIVQAD